MDFATKTIHAGQPSEPETGAVVPPIFQTTTYQQMARGNTAASTTRARTIRRASGSRRVLAELEGGTRAAVFGSGLAAENAILQAYLKPGDEIVVPGDVYGGTFRMLHKVFEPIGCIDHADGFQRSRTRSARRSRRRRGSCGSSRRPTRACSSTTSRRSPARARGGRAGRRRQHVRDAVLSAAVRARRRPGRAQRDEIPGRPLGPRAGRRHREGSGGVRAGRSSCRTRSAAFPSPFDCWLTLRGLKTLELRMLRHAENAIAIAEALSTHPRVKRVYFPGLPTHPGHAIARKQMSGFGGMVSFELDGTVEETSRVRVVAAVLRAGREPRRRQGARLPAVQMTHASIPAETRRALGLSDTLVRLSPGCESARDLVQDLVWRAGSGSEESEEASNLQLATESSQWSRRALDPGSADPGTPSAEQIPALRCQMYHAPGPGRVCLVAAVGCGPKKPTRRHGGGPSAEGRGLLAQAPGCSRAATTACSRPGTIRRDSAVGRARPRCRPAVRGRAAADRCARRSWPWTVGFRLPAPRRSCRSCRPDVDGARYLADGRGRAGGRDGAAGAKASARRRSDAQASMPTFVGRSQQRDRAGSQTRPAAAGGAAVSVAVARLRVLRRARPRPAGLAPLPGDPRSPDPTPARRRSSAIAWRSCDHINGVALER